MAPQYKLTYFNGRGMAEGIRFILAYAGADFEDVRIEREKWPEVKPTLNLPFGQVPILEFDGKTLSQSRAISRYLANEFGLAGKDKLESARCDEIVDGLADLFMSIAKFRWEEDAAKKAELKKVFENETLPKALKNFQTILEKNGTGYLVGKGVTWADLVLSYGLQTLLEHYPTALDKAVPLKELNNKIVSNPKIKAYLDKRPVTEF